jgi:hypothetical protein
MPPTLGLYPTPNDVQWDMKHTHHLASEWWQKEGPSVGFQRMMITSSNENMYAQIDYYIMSYTH